MINSESFLSFVSVTVTTAFSLACIRGENNGNSGDGVDGSGGTATTTTTTATTTATAATTATGLSGEQRDSRCCDRGRRDRVAMVMRGRRRSWNQSGGEEPRDGAKLCALARPPTALRSLVPAVPFFLFVSPLLVSTRQTESYLSNYEPFIKRLFFFLLFFSTTSGYS